MTLSADSYSTGGHRVRHPDGPSSGLVERIEATRRLLADAPAADVVAESRRPRDMAALSVACWADRRRVVFPPTLQDSVVDDLVDRRGLVQMSALGQTAQSEPTDALIRAAFDPADIEPADVLAEFFTSGTTGNPTRVPKRASQLIGEARVLAEFFEIGRHDVVVSTVPANHLYGYLFSVLVPMVSGCRIADSTPLHAESVAALCDEVDATVLVSTPTQIRTFTTVASGGFPPLKRVFSSAAALPAETRRDLGERGLGVTEIFGSTETGGIAWKGPGRPNIWMPLGPVDIRVGDDQRLHVRSPFTDQPERYLATDDRVERRDDGFEHRGRADDVVKVGGRRVSKAELGRRLGEHRRVRAAGIVEIEAESTSNTRLYGFVEADSDVDALELRRHLAQWFEPATIPRLHVVEELPKTAVGKVSRETLEELIDQVDAPRPRPTLSISEPAEPSPGVWQVEVGVPADSIYFDGHFDGFPILAGVVQVSEIVVKQVARIWADFEAPRRIRRLKFLAPIGPGAQLVLTLERRGNTVAFGLADDSTTCCSGKLQYGEPSGDQ